MGIEQGFSAKYTSSRSARAGAAGYPRLGHSIHVHILVSSSKRRRRLPLDPRTHCCWKKQVSPADARNFHRALMETAKIAYSGAADVAAIYGVCLAP